MIALLLAVLPYEPLPQHVDLIERNRVYDDAGNQRFEQLIFWRWNGWDGRHEVVDWKCSNQCRIRGWDGRCYRVSIGELRVVAPFWRDTESMFDPGVEDRAVLAIDARIKLRRRSLERRPQIAP